MNKKQNPEDVLNQNKTIRFTKKESKAVQQKADKAGVSFSEFCRQMALKGYVQAERNSYDMNEIRICINLLLENKTAISRMSNLIKGRHPQLYEEMMRLKESFQQKIDRINL